MHLGKIIYQYRMKNHKMSMDDFAYKSGLSKSYIAMLEKNCNPSTGKEIAPSIEIIKKVAVAMNIDFNELFSMMEGENVSLLSEIIDFARIPVYNHISCGTGGFVENDIIDYVMVPDEWLTKYKEYFGQRAKGDSMINAGIQDGDILVFEKSGVVESGFIGCFCIDEDIATCKKFLINNENEIYLMPANDNYTPIKIDVDNQHFRAIGKLAFVVSDRRNK